MVDGVDELEVCCVIAADCAQRPPVESDSYSILLIGFQAVAQKLNLVTKMDRLVVLDGQYLVRKGLRHPVSAGILYPMDTHYMLRFQRVEVTHYLRARHVALCMTDIEDHIAGLVFVEHGQQVVLVKAPYLALTEGLELAAIAAGDSYLSRLGVKIFGNLVQTLSPTDQEKARSLVPPAD